MPQHRDRAFLVLRASSKTDRGVRRNHPLLRWREGIAREQHVEENLRLSTPPLEHLTTEGVLWWKMENRRDEMEILYERCAGVDVHKKNVKVCFAFPGEGGQRQKETRTYASMTQNVLEMRD